LLLSQTAANGVLLEDLEDLGVDGLYDLGMTRIEAKKLLRKVRNHHHQTLASL
jgi:hypothetical protein